MKHCSYCLKNYDDDTLDTCPECNTKLQKVQVLRTCPICHHEDIPEDAITCYYCGTYIDPVKPQTLYEEGKRYIQGGENYPQDFQIAKFFFDRAGAYKIPEAIYESGKLAMLGKGMPIDESMAIEQFEKAAHLGHAAAQYYLGRFLFYGIATDKNTREATEWFLKAAKNGNTLAQDQIGRQYQLGIGMEVNSVASKQWFSVAAAQGENDALGICYLEGIGREINLQLSYQHFTLAAEQGNVFAMKHIASACENGSNGAPHNVAISIDLYGKAAKMGDPFSQYKFGYYLMEGTGNVQPKEKEGIKWLLKAATQKDNIQKDAMLLLGDCYAEGKGEKINHQKAFYYYEKAAAAGSIKAAFLKAKCLFIGLGTEKNYKKLFSLLNDLKQKTDKADYYPKVIYMLGRCYEEGLGTVADIKKALENYKIIPDYKPAKLRIAVLRQKGKGIKKNEKLAFSAIKEILKEDLSNEEELKQQLMYELGNCYEHGLGTTRDYSKALALYTNAGDNLEATMRLGYFYEHGKAGLETDYNEAEKLYDEAENGVGNIYSLCDNSSEATSMQEQLNDKRNRHKIIRKVMCITICGFFIIVANAIGADSDYDFNTFIGSSIIGLFLGSFIYKYLPKPNI